MINLLDIHTPKQPYPNHSNIEFENIDFYWTLAKKLVNQIIKNVHVAQMIIKNDDYISHLATQLMIADWTWDGRGNKYGYRKQCMVWSLKTIFTRHKKQHKCLHLIVDTLIDKHKDIQHNENIDLIKHMLSHSKLTNKQQKYIKMYYLEGRSLNEVGQYYGVSREAIRSNVKGGLDKIRRKYQCLMS